MRYVLDTSVALKWVLNEPGSSKAIALRSEFRNKIHELVAPDTFIVEAAHALTKAERRGIVQPGEGQILLADILTTPPHFEPFLSVLDRAMEISSQKGVGVYDCLFVALAEQEHCDLVTADAKLLRNLPSFPIVELDTLP
jgi:predicted nucleic acid-binding protein